MRKRCELKPAINPLAKLARVINVNAKKQMFLGVARFNFEFVIGSLDFVKPVAYFTTQNGSSVFTIIAD